MGYFDDFQLINVTQVRNYGDSAPEMILTPHHYIGVIQGEVIIAGETVKKPLLYFTPRGIMTYNGWRSPRNARRDNFYIECSGARADRLFEAVEARDRCRHFFIPDAAPFTALLSEMRRHFTAPGPLSQAETVLCFEQFAALLSRSQLYPGTGKKFHIEEIMAAVSAAPEKDWDFAREAEKCGITLRHWNRLFTATSGGMAPHRFLAQCRLRRARELLSSGPLTIKEIAALAGFEGASEFSRFFKKMCGMTPGEFRKTRIR
jgi:AraC-like DNA-binding protein